MTGIKVNRALALSAVGRFPGSAEEMLGRIPETVIAQLTSHGLALMLDAMWSACQASKAIAERDAIDEGCIWDSRRGRLVELRH